MKTLSALLIALFASGCAVSTEQEPCLVVENGTCLDSQWPNWHEERDEDCQAEAQSVAPCPDLKANRCDDFWEAHAACMMR